MPVRTVIHTKVRTANGRADAALALLTEGSMRLTLVVLEDEAIELDLQRGSGYRERMPEVRLTVRTE